MKKILLLLILFTNIFTVFSENWSIHDVKEYFNYIGCSHEYILFPLSLSENTTDYLNIQKKNISDELFCSIIFRQLNDNSLPGIDNRIQYSSDEKFLIFISILNKFDIRHKVFYNFGNTNLFAKINDNNNTFTFDKDLSIISSEKESDKHSVINLDYFDILSLSLTCKNENLLRINNLDVKKSIYTAEKISPDNILISFLTLNKKISYNFENIKDENIQLKIRDLSDNLKSLIYANIMEQKILDEDYFEALRYSNYFNKLIKDKKISPNDKDLLFSEYIIPIICNKKLNNLPGIKKNRKKLKYLLKNKFIDAEIARKAIYFLASSEFYEEAVEISILWTTINSEDIGLNSIREYISILSADRKHINKLEKAIKNNHKIIVRNF